MGSSNGATRGQLRPYLSGRTPPFVLVGLLVVLGILGFSYWSLNTQYNDLQTEIQKLQERLRIYGEKRESVEKLNSALQVQMQIYKEENKKYKITIDKRDQEVTAIAEQLRSREEEVNKANSQIDTLKSDLEKYETRDKQKDMEISSLQDQTKSQKVEIQELADSKALLLEQIDTLKADINNQHKKDDQFNSNSVNQGVLPGLPDERSKEVNSLNPDVGMPPQNRDLVHPINPVFKPPQIQKDKEESKVPTIVPESPDVGNPEKLQDVTVTSKVQPSDNQNIGANEVDSPINQNSVSN